jgi:transcriptional regulator
MVYLPAAFTETDRDVLAAHIERHEFALVVSHGASGLVASHVPILLDRDGENWRLLGHLARPNPQVADFTAGGEVLAIFSGPHAYVSPRWYETGPAVPTWNYADVHAYGNVRLVKDEAWLRGFLRRLSQRHEGQAAAPWRLDDLPGGYLAGMLTGIVGFEIAVSRLEGKFKLSQNRPSADRPRILAALAAEDDADARAVARLMREREPS